MARRADDQRLAPHLRHERGPRGLAWPRLAQLLEAGDLVDCHRGAFLAQLACPHPQPQEKFPAGEADRDLAGVGNDRPPVLPQSDPAEACYQVPLALALHPCFKAAPQTVAGGNLRPVPGGHLGDRRAVLERKVLGSAIAPKMLAGLHADGLVGLGILPGPLRRPLSYSRPLLAAPDYKGVRIGINPSDLTEDLIRAVGAVVVVRQRGGVVSSGEDMTGLGGLEADTIGIDAGLDTRGAVLTGNVVFWPNFNVVFVNRRALESLTAAQRNELVRAAAVASSSSVWEQSDAASMRDLCHRGIKVRAASDADLAGLMSAARPVYRLLESSASTRAFIEQITALRRSLRDTPNSVTCIAAKTAGRPTGDAAQLDGTWQVTYTKAQLVAAGAGPGDLLPSEGKWGRFTMRFSRGHWWLTGPPSTTGSASGTYVVTGSQIRFDRHDHAYAGSDTEVWGPYIWSVYRDALTFKTTGWIDTQGPMGLVVKPWQKIGP